MLAGIFRNLKAIEKKCHRKEDQKMKKWVE